MISVDDVTLTTCVSDDYDVKFRPLMPGHLSQHQRSDIQGSDRWWHYTWRPGLVVGWCPDTRVVEYKLSVPRLFGAVYQLPPPGLPGPGGLAIG
jgi:hypothetical protein